jgi:hypothetical protein
MSTIERPTPHRWVVAIGAVAAIMLLGLVLVLTADDHDARSSPPAGSASTPAAEVSPTTAAASDPEPRFVYAAMPPFTAEPSAPDTGELVAAVTWRTDDEAWMNGAMYLYADGRLISISGVDDATLGSGWTERRLTPEGVELVRSEILSSGLFDPGRETPSPLGTFGNSIVVRDGDRLLYPQWVGDVPDSFLEVVAHVRDLNAWLPEHAWEQREQEQWDPAHYGVCFRRETGTVDSPLEETAATISALDPGVADVTADARHWQPPHVLSTEPGPDCYDVKPAAAHGLARGFERALDDPLLTAVSRGEDGYEFEAAPPLSALIHISFVPLLPDGELAIVEVCTEGPPGQCTR